MSTQQVVPIKLKVGENTYLFRAPPAEEAIVGIDLENTHTSDAAVDYYVIKNGTDKPNQAQLKTMAIERAKRRKRGNIHIPPGYFLIGVTKFPGQVVRVYTPTIYTKPGMIAIKPGAYTEVEVFIRGVPNEYTVRAVTKMIGVSFASDTQVISANTPAKFIIFKKDISETDGEIVFLIDELKAAAILDVQLFKEESKVWEGGINSDTMMADVYRLSRDSFAK